MTSLPDAERDATEAVRLLAALAGLLRQRGLVPDDETESMLGMALDGGVSAARVRDYLRALQGAGDGVAVAVPPRLGLWRDWVPPRGDLFDEMAGAPRGEESRRPRLRRDPGE